MALETVSLEQLEELVKKDIETFQNEGFPRGEGDTFPVAEYLLSHNVYVVTIRGRDQRTQHIANPCFRVEASPHHSLNGLNIALLGESDLRFVVYDSNIGRRGREPYIELTHNISTVDIYREFGSLIVIADEMVPEQYSYGMKVDMTTLSIDKLG